MAEGIDVMSDTTGQKIVDALSANADNTKWVYFSNKELYDNYSTGVEKDGVSVGKFDSRSLYGSDFAFDYNFIEGNVIVPNGDYGSTSYMVNVPEINVSSSATGGVKISAPGKILMLKIAIRNSGTSSHTARVVNTGGVIVFVASVTSKGECTLDCDLTESINSDSVLYFGMNEDGGDNCCYGISVCYKT